MKRHYYVLMGIYFLSFILSLIGFVVDTDFNNNSVFMNAFEIMAMSLLIFGVVAGTIFGLYAFYSLLVKKISKEKLVE